MKIYYIKNKNLKGTGIPVPFCGLVSIDIGYRTCGVTIINPEGKFKTIDCRPIAEGVNLAKLSIPDYFSLSLQIGKLFIGLTKKNPKLKTYMWSMEIPNIIGSYAPALSVLLAVLSTVLLFHGVPVIFYTGNRLGGFFLKKRSYTKTEIKKFVKASFGIDYKLSDHEADSCLQAYSIYKGVFKKYLNGTKLRDFELELEDITP